MARASSFSGGWTRNVLTGESWGYIDRTSDQTPDTQIQHHRRSEHVAEKTFRLPDSPERSIQIPQVRIQAAQSLLSQTKENSHEIANFEF